MSNEYEKAYDLNVRPELWKEEDFGTSCGRKLRADEELKYKEFMGAGGWTEGLYDLSNPDTAAFAWNNREFIQPRELAFRVNGSLKYLFGIKSGEIEKSKSKTLVVNLFAGPGAGKTTCAWEIASKLKKLRINTEYVSEYAKELVWDEDFERLKDQEHVTNEQYSRLNRLNGKVDVIITDSPVLLGAFYGRQNGMSPAFEKEVLKKFNSFENFNLWIKRGEHYEVKGRIENEDEAKSVDKALLKILKENNIYFGTYSHQTIDLLVANIVKTLDRINPESVSHVGEVGYQMEKQRKFVKQTKTYKNDNVAE